MVVNLQLNGHDRSDCVPVAPLLARLLAAENKIDAYNYNKWTI